MKPLTLDDLIPLDEYAGRRRELVGAHRRYLDRYRRVRIGPRLTLVFENRQTLWFRVQEIVRIARLTEADLLQQELDLHNALLPRREMLQAALVIDVPAEADFALERAKWQELRGEHFALCAGECRYAATLVTCRPEDRCTGTAHWVQFGVDAAGRRLLADPGMLAWFAFDNGVERHHSPPLNEDLRQSLVDDLQLSERD